MDDHRRIIKENREKLVETVDVMNTSLLDQLVQKDVITQEQFASIKDKYNNNIQRVSALLDHLHRRPFEDWSVFLKCLLNSGYDFLVKELSSPVADFQDLQRLAAKKIWDKYHMVEVWSLQEQCKSVPVEDIFVDVELRCKLPKRCHVLTSYREVLTQFSEASTIHIFGQPGTGKSMLSTRLCFDWASQYSRGVKRIKADLGGKFGDLKFILPVHLKDVKHGYNFLDVVADSCGLEGEEAEAMCRYVEKYQESTVLVCDGLDEYDGLSEEITKIRKLYPRIKMLITSRNTVVEDKANTNYKCPPALELTLHGFSDEGVQEYVEKTCQGFPGVVEDILLVTKKVSYLACLSHNPAFLLLIINLWQAASNKNQDITEKDFFLEFVAYAIGQNENKQKRVYPVRKSTYLLIREHQGLIMSLGKLASTSVKEDRMDQEFSSAVISDHINPVDLKVCLEFGFLLKQQCENEQCVYRFVHKAIQDMFLCYFLGEHLLTELLDLALAFCECQKAFLGCDISRLTSFFKDYGTRGLIETLCSGKEEDLARLHTDLQLQSLQDNEEADLVLPRVTYISIGSGNFEQVTKYFSKNGSRLEKLTVRSHEKFLCLLDNLTAPKLTCLTKLHSAEGIYNVEQCYIDRIVPALLRFPLEVLKIEDLYSLSELVRSAIVQAASEIETLEYLSFSFGTLTAEHIHALCGGLPGSNLTALVIRQCDLKIESLLEIIDVLPNCPRLENLDVSKNYIKFGVERLVEKTDKFFHLRKLNMSLNQIPTEIKQQIKGKLQCYPELELEIDV